MIEFIEKIKNNAFLKDNKLAYHINDQSITYKDLYNESLKYADYLQRQGNEPVIIYGHKSINMVISILACLLAKRAYVPLDKFVPIERIKKIIKLSKASLLIKNEKININTIQNCTLDNLYRYNKDKVPNDNKVAYIIFTSGSTGEPKGVPISYDNLNNFCKWIGSIEPLNEYQNINVLNQASFSFDLSVADFYYSLCYNHTLISIEHEKQNDFKELFYTIKSNRINLMVITPTFIKMCLLDNGFNEKKFKDLKCLYFCGELLDVSTVKKIFERFPSIQVINAYGPTEATSAVSSILITNEMLNNELLPVGDMDHVATTIEIINDEIVLKGESVFNGYLKESGGHYLENGINCYHTGDIGFIDNNKLYCKGRMDNQIKYMGYRIELFEIENTIKNVDGVIDSIVVAKRNNDGTVKLIKAFAILKEDYTIEMIKDKLNKYLPSYMIPKFFKKVDSFPLNSNGKIDRKKMIDL